MSRIIALGLALSFIAVRPVVAQSRPTWNTTIGAGMLLVPSYPGSDEYRALSLPLVRVSYRDRVQVGPNSGSTGYGVGIIALRTTQLTVDAELGVQQDRPATRGKALVGMDDRTAPVSAGASATYTRGMLTGVVGVAQGLNDRGGLLGSAQVTLLRPLSARMFATIGAGATFADARQMQREFGVTGPEALRRQALVAANDPRLPATGGTVYAPNGGLRQVSATFSVMRLLTAHWALVGLGGVDRLGRGAAASSLVQRRMQVTGGMVLGYRF